MAGPSSWPFDKTVADTICDLVAEGQNLHVIGKLDGYPPRWRIYEWLKEDEAFANNYARAREDRADWRSARIDSIVSKLLSAEIDPSAARVAIEAEKWQAGKEKPKVYGDKTTLAGDADNPVQVQGELRVVLVRPKESAGG
ncbi:MAG: hypothetical protein J0I79_16495 [Mesorhizobium sp.]|uniref:terminase small subunit-like protein n=1 Tax=Mesorhizobium sp. TaxID=1871066 RepID=UPI001ACB3255|nr:hypothetical protein [Mesorhizobium sp.]MBN9219546.1 hypothetical protein [Mesorhizobium sp.]